ncbi:extracellular catalytic domain type 1 short-chain-length polyhydroxyalkanoate depolymerase [Duganella qianjiadongensis]|uniref:Prolyl oligopeptidase family serine peptidase n=1 Tax=Duganella qianjiadongensis TaxID=2692176 RepID=A0ABW9VQ95_9BURK|nr:PHB depolymerase family esterase [Duganella qianjiadongensis]MYM41736.1 prolyl oligopeptidase family serine peptidase [Duganella qianjiadongensis]
MLATQQLAAVRTAQAQTRVPLAQAGAKLEELYVHGRKVLVHVPSGYDSTRVLPLVLGLHGGGGHAELMADDNRYGWLRQADQGGFIVAFPNGASRLPGGRLATWNAGGCCGYARDQNLDDVAFLRAVVAELRGRYRIDSARVFAAGMSNGGMMAHRLACDAADLFRAVASVAGTDASAGCQPSRPIPVLHIHARDDDHVLYAGGAGPAAFRDRRSVMEFVSVPDTIARWVQRDQCQNRPVRVLEVAGGWCEAYRDCSAGSSVELCVTQTGGHSWPGSRAGQGSQAFDATELIWRFFSAQSAPPSAAETRPVNTGR